MRDHRLSRSCTSRHWRSLAVGLLACLAMAPTAVAGASNATASRAALPAGSIKHILVIDLENEGYSATFGPGSPATYLNGTLRKKGVLLSKYYGTGHFSLDNYIAQVSGQSPTGDTQADCSANGFAFAPVSPGTPYPKHSPDYGQVSGNGCVYPHAVATIANQLDAKYRPNHTTHVASWRAYQEDMGNDPPRDGGTNCAHPALGATDTAEVATSTDQYTTRHNPFVWFQSIIGNTAECAANDVPLGQLGSNGQPAPQGALAHDLRSLSTTPRFGFVTPNLCDDGHDGTCAGANSAGTHVGGLAGADLFLQHWMPLILHSPAYRNGSMLVVVTFDEADVDSSDPAYAEACCHEPTGPNTPSPGNASATSDTAPGGGRTGALLLNARHIAPGTVDSSVAYNHYSALRSYEDLLGLTSGGADGHGHLGYAAAAGLRPFGRDVFARH
jgi:hypothetical protein